MWAFIYQSRFPASFEKRKLSESIKCGFQESNNGWSWGWIGAWVVGERFVDSPLFLLPALFLYIFESVTPWRRWLCKPWDIRDHSGRERSEEFQATGTLQDRVEDDCKGDLEKTGWENEKATGRRSRIRSRGVVLPHTTSKNKLKMV